MDASDNTISERVRTTDNLNVRSTPGGSLIRMIARGIKGTILNEEKITKGGHQWVKVKFDNGTQGYVASSYLTKESTTSVNTGAIATKPFNQMTKAEIIELLRLLIERIQQLRQ